MKGFTINTENNITAYPSKSEALRGAGEGSSVFSTQEELAEYTAAWPTSRLVQIWNSLPGVSPVKKFTDRKTAAARIWKTIQTLEPSPSIEAEGQGKLRAGTKTAAVIEMLRRPEGATVPEIMAAMVWQPHSVRGFLSNLKRAGHAVDSRKRQDGARAYFLPADSLTDQEQKS